MDLRPGDLLFVWASELITEFIQEVTDGPSHVAMIIDDETVCEAQAGRLSGEERLTFYTEGEFERLELWRDFTLTDAERSRMVETAKALYGIPYDYKLILLELAHFEWHTGLGWYQEDDSMICSTYMNVVARSVGRIWSKVPNPAPVDLLEGGALLKVGDLIQISQYRQSS